MCPKGHGTKTLDHSSCAATASIRRLFFWLGKAQLAKGSELNVPLRSDSMKKPDSIAARLRSFKELTAGRRCPGLAKSPFRANDLSSTALPRSGSPDGSSPAIRAAVPLAV